MAVIVELAGMTCKAVTWRLASRVIYSALRLVQSAGLEIAVQLKEIQALMFGRILTDTVVPTKSRPCGTAR
jgi:hypothetical protein